VVILSNQGGVKLQTSLKQDSKRTTEFKAKIGAIMNHFNFPVNLYAATERDQYRKPRTGMWRQMLNDFGLDNDQGVDLENSFYVGDAAGRISDEKGDVNDFASSDRYFGYLHSTNLANGTQRSGSQYWDTFLHPRGVLFAPRS